MKKNQFFCTKSKFSVITCVVIASLTCFQAYSQPGDLPIIPVGMDAYRMWEQWPVQRIGARAYMRSTYDRAGSNESADASHFLFMKQEEDNSVTLDVEGKGILYFVRTNHWHGSPWRYVIDGNTHVIKEMATDYPVDAKNIFKKTTFIPESAFPEPFAWTWSTTHGADLMYVPMGFEKSLQLAYGRTHYGTGYYIYHLYGDEDRLSQAIRPWNPGRIPDKDVLDLVRLAGTDIAPQAINKESGIIHPDKENALLAQITSAPSCIRALKLKLPLSMAETLERARLRITWDGRKQASVDAPLCLFFGAGTLYNRNQQEYLVKGFPLNIRYDYRENKVELSCYYPMPFFKSAKVELYNITNGAGEIEYEIRYEPYSIPADQTSYFHATYRDFATQEIGKDMIFLDTQGMEGASEWSGSFVGTSFIFTHRNRLETLEGDPRFFFDNSNTPQGQATGTEEWGGGGDYWGGRNMTLPFAGHPCGVVKKEDAKNDKDMIHSAYRFLLGDLMPFGNRAKIHLEHGGENLSTEHYESVTYWYGLPAPSLIKTDELNIGDWASEKKHQYSSPQASTVQTIKSRYEWGIDSISAKKNWSKEIMEIPGFKPGMEIYPAHEETGRYTKGTSEFTVKMDPNNHGAMLRRTLDYSFPNQKAEVYISDANGKEWKYAGVWYLAGSNTCVYSNPRGELDKRLYNVQTSNRRFRDDEFLISEKLTRGRSSIRIRIQFVPVERELYPGMPFPQENAWSELRYQVYSFITPKFKLAK